MVIVLLTYVYQSDKKALTDTKSVTMIYVTLNIKIRVLRFFSERSDFLLRIP